MLTAFNQNIDLITSTVSPEIELGGGSRYGRQQSFSNREGHR